MATSPFEWKILEWDEKPKTNKQIQQWIINIYLKNLLSLSYTSCWTSFRGSSPLWFLILSRYFFIYLEFEFGLNNYSELSINSRLCYMRGPQYSPFPTEISVLKVRTWVEHSPFSLSNCFRCPHSGGIFYLYGGNSLVH